MSLNDNTPHKKKPSGSKSASHMSTNTKTLQKLREEAAADQRRECLLNCAEVVNCSKPTSRAASNAAEKLAESLYKGVEDALSSIDNNTKPKSSSLAIPASAMENVTAFHRWFNGNLTAKKRPEAEIADGYVAFVRYIGLGIGKAMTSTRAMSEKPKRVLLPCNVDKKPTDSDENIRVDVAFVAHEDTPSLNPLDRAQFRDIFALTEIKARANLLDDAYDQLLQYTRQIFATQHNRRFAWGLTLCDAVVKVALFTNDHMIASDNMDLRFGKDRKEFIRLLVNFSFCDMERLGYDNSIRWIESAQCWEIDCPAFDNGTGASAGVRKYYARDPSDLVADRLFGRHTRGFLASLHLENVDTPDTFIKDAWPHASDGMEDPRDEVEMLRDIDSALSKEEYADVLHIHVECGGIVQLERKTDDTRAIYGSEYDAIKAAVDVRIKRELATELKNLDMAALSTYTKDRKKQSIGATFPFRAHKRIATSPVGQSLFSLSSPYELMIVLADAMRTHAAILKECGILHRDLSTNNILAVGSGRNVRGLLIDFDCALRLDRVGSKEWKRRLERTGTPPFMSIGNLSNINVPRSALGDWESVLYIVCWMGINGANEEDREERYKMYAENKKAFRTYESPLERWEFGSYEQIGEAKRTNMITTDMFRNSILNNFIVGEGYSALKNLAKFMHEIIFFNHRLNDECHGVVPRSANPTNKEAYQSVNLLAEDDVSLDNSKNVNPFEHRFKNRAEICKDLGTLLKNAVDAARSRL